MTSRSDYITIERYSDYGFVPQYQSHHLKNIIPILKTDEDFLKYYQSLTEYQKQMMLSYKHSYEDFFRENIEDFQYGIWAFIKGYKDKQSLNHLKAIPKVNYAMMPKDTIVYDCNWQRKSYLSNYFCRIYGCYIPKSSLTNLIIL